MKKKDYSPYGTFSLNKIDSPKGKPKGDPKSDKIVRGNSDLRNKGGR